MAGAIIWLVIKGTKYIRKLHQQHTERMESLMKENWSRAEEMIKAVNNMAASDRVMATSLDNNTSTMERTAVVIGDLHRYIVGQRSPAPKRKG